MKIGLFVPIGNNGWIISTTSPQYKPSFEFEKEVVTKAEGYGFDFALSMIKYRARCQQPEADRGGRFDRS